MTATAPGPLPADASLHLLATHLADALADEQLEPCLLHVGGVNGEGFDLGVLPLDGRHPTGDLLGFTAPDDWHALGLACHGWAYHVSERAHAGRRRTRVHTVTLVSRTGELAHRTRVDGCSSMAEQLEGQPPAGEQVDLLRRCLGLDTDPAPCDASVYWSIAWLAALLDDEPTPSDWADAVERHPAMALLRRAEWPSESDTAEILRSFHRVCDWDRMRSLAASGRYPVAELLPEEAAWLDDGAFARFVLSRCPPLRHLLDRVHDQLPGELVERIIDLLDELDVPAAAWPDTFDAPPAA